MLPTYRAGRVTTIQRWFRWLEDQDGIIGHPMAAVWAAILAARTGRPVEADRWADVVDHWEHQPEAQTDSPVAAAWAAVLRALLCRRAVKQMRADGVLKRQPDLGTLVSDAQALRVRLTQERGSNVPGPSALTTAELRVLPLLATHLSFREIGAELFLSQNTVKSQAISVYRKLAAANRSQAVVRARGLGLLEG